MYRTYSVKKKINVFRLSVRYIKRFAITIFLLFSFPIMKSYYDDYKYRVSNRLIENSRWEFDDGIPDIQPPRFHEGKCDTKEHNVAFLKTHKTASSTITSFLNRFADINNLDMAIPRGDRFGWPQSFKSTEVDLTRTKSKKANILCNHAMFNRKEFYKVMQSPFKLITILRNPVDQLYSAFYYGGFKWVYKLWNYTDPVAKFIEQPKEYYTTFMVQRGYRILPDEFTLYNSQTHDLNFKRFQMRFQNNTLDDFIQYIDNTFHLVLITEYFDEGIIMLKTMLCWGYMDFVYEKKLISGIQRPVISSETRHRIEAWNYRDLKLYNFFKGKFLRIKSKFDREKFSEKVEKFQILNRIVSSFCANKENKTVSNVLKKDVIDYLEELREDPPALFIHNPTCFCKKIALSERNYLKYFEKRYPSLYYLMSDGQRPTLIC